ncbi:MAG: hypothetical protein IPK81_11510 [Rhodospirillales bacterium]|nr:hypothetical protein [Rhodospirillales bacterium]QQS14716.1 MAG: hypothetical protein IPK81_11510 [Rhodospirillales bacterium]
MRKPLATAAMLAVLFPAALLARTLELVNESSVTIEHLFVAWAGDKGWGPDQLGSSRDDIVAPGASFRLNGLEKDTFDLKIVTHTGQECVIEGVHFRTNMRWTVTDKVLRECR